MADEEREPGGSPSPLSIVMRPSFPGFRQLWRRWGGRKPPRYDGTKPQVEYQPRYRVVEWYGAGGDYGAEPPHQCGDPPFCSVPHGLGRHSQVIPDGFDWAGTHFTCLEEALRNQAFAEWYEGGDGGPPGKEIMDRGQMTLYKPLYADEKKPPLPKYNFFLDEHVHEMSVQEIRAYQRTGEVPKRFQRRGRAKES